MDLFNFNLNALHPDEIALTNGAIKSDFPIFKYLELFK